MKQLERDFSKIPISTKTMVVLTNAEFFTDHLFTQLPVHSLTVPDQLKTDKKKLKRYVQELSLEEGLILALEHMGDTRGDIPIGHFRNHMSIIMIVNQKMLNFKIPKKGKIQMTGCKDDSYAEKCIDYLWGHIQTHHTPEKPLYRIKTGEQYFQTLFRTEMTNKNFNLGFKVLREELDRYINTMEEDGRFSHLDTTFGYTGVNIKFPITHANSLFKTKRYEPGRGWVEGWIDYNEYLNRLSPKEYSDEINKKRYNSFFIFHSGSAIMSGMSPEYMEQDFYSFLEIIDRCKNLIKEDVKK